MSSVFAPSDLAPLSACSRSVAVFHFFRGLPLNAMSFIDPRRGARNKNMFRATEFWGDTLSSADWPGPHAYSQRGVATPLIARDMGGGVTPSGKKVGWGVGGSPPSPLLVRFWAVVRPSHRRRGLSPPYPHERGAPPPLTGRPCGGSRGANRTRPAVPREGLSKKG